MFGLGGLTLESLPMHPKFKQHSGTFIKTLNYIVANLNDLDKVSTPVQSH